MLDECLDAESGLRTRELEFIEDLDGRRHRPLSDKQHDWLLDIASKLP